MQNLSALYVVLARKAIAVPQLPIWISLLSLSWELLSEIHILPMLLSSEYNRTFYWAFWVGHDDPAPDPVNERNPPLAGDALFFTAADRGWRYSHRFFDTVVFSLRAPGERDRQGRAALHRLQRHRSVHDGLYPGHHRVAADHLQLLIDRRAQIRKRMRASGHNLPPA